MPGGFRVFSGGGRNPFYDCVIGVYVTNFISRFFGQRDERNIVLVFVDAENSTIEPGRVLETVEAEFGKPRVRQAYAKWSANPFYKNESRKYRDAGFETITCNTGNNNADIQLSVEAVDMMHDFGNRGKCTLIICADGDRGFAHVFDKARKLGWKSVLIANEKRGTLSDILRNSADRVISLDVSPDEPVKTEAQTTGKTGDKKQTDFQEIDRQWHEKAGEDVTINNATAGRIANDILGSTKLKSTPYKNLKGVIQSSNLLTRNWERAGQYEIKKKGVDNSALATLTPSVIPESDAQRIPGFNTTSRLGKPSLRYPARPEDLARLILLFESHRNEETSWSNLKAKIVGARIVAKARTEAILRMIDHVSTGIRPSGSQNLHEIKWDLVNNPLDLSLALRDECIDRFNEKLWINNEKTPEIEKYFEQVSDEILSLKKK